MDITPLLRSLSFAHTLLSLIGVAMSASTPNELLLSTYRGGSFFTYSMDEVGPPSKVSGMKASAQELSFADQEKDTFVKEKSASIEEKLREGKNIDTPGMTAKDSIYVFSKPSKSSSKKRKKSRSAASTKPPLQSTNLFITPKDNACAFTPATQHTPIQACSPHAGHAVNEKKSFAYTILIYLLIAWNLIELMHLKHEKRVERKRQCKEDAKEVSALQ